MNLDEKEIKRIKALHVTTKIPVVSSSPTWGTVLVYPRIATNIPTIVAANDEISLSTNE